MKKLITLVLATSMMLVSSLVVAAPPNDHLESTKPKQEIHTYAEHIAASGPKGPVNHGGDGYPLDDE